MDRNEHLPPQGPESIYGSPHRVTTYSYSLDGKVEITEHDAESAAAPAYTFEHDSGRGVYRLKWSDGRVEVFRDKPVRYLVLEPDHQSGELRPATTRGCPTYLYLCREEREVS